MASNGLLRRAKNGKCRICQRVRSTIDKVKTVGDVHHGFATGYIWECIDTKECQMIAELKLANYDSESQNYKRIKQAIELHRQHPTH